MSYEPWKVLFFLLFSSGGYLWSGWAFGAVQQIENEVSPNSGNIEIDPAEETTTKNSNNVKSIGVVPESDEGLFFFVSEKARVLSKAEYRENTANLPESLESLNYQQYRSIRFDRESSLWKSDAEFEVQPFHPGFLYKNLTRLNVVDQNSESHLLPFNSDYFIYERESENLRSEIEADQNSEASLGYAGFRIHYPLNSGSYKDELLVFQGASYFRPVGPSQIYGLSGRGLAIDTGEPEGEEFPYFVDFWLQKPTDNPHILNIFAILDSPSVAGAFWFSLKPGLNTVIDVKSVLYPRKNIKKLGVAPLTSMFLYGENKTIHIDDFRPEIHDSDGLQIQTGSGEWLWRPLVNPRELSITSSVIQDLKGFGLAQRDRQFINYSDLEANYEKRPSVWIQPQSDWGEGRVELVEIPTNTETNDNIVTYWVPLTPVEAGTQLRFDYRISTFETLPVGFETAYVTSSRTGWAAMPGDDNPPPTSHRQFVVDFSGTDASRLNSATPIHASLELSSGEYENLRVVKLPEGLGWRVYFTVIPTTSDVIDMRMNLSLHGNRISEIWNYVWNSNAIQ